MFVVVFALLLAYAVLPAPARAAGPTQEQVQAVVSLLKSFGTEQAVLENVQLALKGASREELLKAMAAKMPPQGTDAKPGTMPAGACVAFARTLVRGAVGDDVAKLQEFLKRTGDLKEASTTTYFGPTTEAALKAWQAREGIASSGDAASTGFGAAGPKTRQLLMERCGGTSANSGAGNSQSSQPMARPGLSSASSTTSPVCTLRASKERVSSGDSVTLKWESRNATEVSTADGGRSTDLSGSVTVTPTETTTYLKKVYNDKGEGQCFATVFVGDDKTSAPEKKLVVVPGAVNIGHVFSLMGSGMAAVMDGYLSLFER